ncbi:hypothetical protein JMG10_46020 [Nostoc ellipsosporum NOK]|nr:hypothetical protein [Nostoc ellipsosporum NOK]
MLQQNRAYILLVAALIIGSSLLTTPVNAQTEVHVIGGRDQNWKGDRRQNYRQDRTPLDRANWNRQNEPTARIVRLRNGDIRLPNGDIVLARRLVRLRDNYFRLPNGDILLPNEEIVPSRRLMRVRDNYFRLPMEK